MWNRNWYNWLWRGRFAGYMSRDKASIWDRLSVIHGLKNDMIKLPLV
jgi:hypothetical protein